MLASFVTLLMPNQFNSNAIVLPISSNHSNSGSFLFQNSVGGSNSILSGLAGLSDDSHGKVILSILASKDLARKVIQNEKLHEILLKPRWYQFWVKNNSINAQLPGMDEAAIATLLKYHIKFKEVKNRPTLSIQVLFDDPEISYRVAQSYLNELEIFINNNSLTLAKRNRVFLEKRLQDNKLKLIQSGKVLSQLLNSASTKEKSSFKVQINSSNLDANTVSEVPMKVYYEYMVNEKRTLENTNDLLSSQYEISKINEAKEEITFQIIDRPYKPHFKSGPKRILIVLISVFLMMVLSMFYYLIIHDLKKYYSNNIFSKT